MQLIDLQCVDGGVAQAPVLDVADVVALEQRIAQDGTSLLELMTRAGSALGACGAIIRGARSHGRYPRGLGQQWRRWLGGRPRTCRDGSQRDAREQDSSR